MQNASSPTLFKSTNVLETLTNSCACHVLCDLPHSLRLPRETQFERPKTSRTPSILTILTSKSLSRYNGVHFLKIKTSKSGPNLEVFNDFDFEIALSLQRVQFLTILTSKSAPRPPVFKDFDFQTALSPQRDAILKILT